MRSLIAIGSIALIGVAGMGGPKPNGLWRSDLIALNGDTIFLASDSSFSIQYNLSSQGLVLRSKADSTVALKASIENFHRNREMFIRIMDDGSAIMTKMRSGGRVYPNELDSGSYEMRHDTIVFTIRTRRNYQFALVHDQKRDILHFTDGLPNHMVYQEYRKED